ncbi:hypothetical protein SEA_SATIS_326 [Streptomyces phage Satis]|nr:hypothetical protein SEA_SATIS_326 [Streptomyces phage Satis]QBZ72212.1 hypothetical protein SEA_KRADAL_326 [Streptomyces phage Kradal]QPL14634.1 hypothetical protein SEA_EHYELIMAYOE_329 [Streptomyces phage EhyElimayoE]
MIATTTDDVREFFRQGDTVVNSRAERHTVTLVSHSGNGFAGVLLTESPGLNGHTRHVVWVVSETGRVRATMTTCDYPAASGAFAARVMAAVGTGETRGCPCGFADYGAPGHEGHPDFTEH